MTELMCRADAENSVHAQLALTNPAPTSADLGAPWIATAEREIGQKEVVGAKANPRIMEYHRVSKLGAEDDSGGVNAWCGSFVAWVLAQHGHGAPTHAYRAKAWVGFCVVIKKPVYGAICYKSRAGGGHVAFFIGQARDEKHYFMLGGNQDDEVNITRYKAGLWESFVFPSGTHPGSTLPVYEGPSKNAGSEA